MPLRHCIDAVPEITGIAQKSALINVALREVIQTDAARRLIALVGSMPDLLAARAVRMHAAIVGELAMGNLRQRHEVLADLSNLAAAQVLGVGYDG